MGGGTVIDGECADIESMPEIRKVPIEGILKQHRQRYIIHTEHYGDVVMRYMTRAARIRMDALRRQMYPELYKWEDELQTLAPMAVLPGADPDTLQRAAELANLIMPTLDMYALACMTNPELGSVEELRDFMDILEPDEAEAVRQILVLCTAHAPPVDTAYLEICQRFNVQVVDPILLDNMTMQQQEVLTAILSAERQHEKDLMKKMGVKV